MLTNVWDVGDPILGETSRKKRKPVGYGKRGDVLIRAKGRCERCGMNLQGIRPHIHHKNGKPSDNKLSNLIVLCPNCHSTMHVWKTKTVYDGIMGPRKKRVLVTKKSRTKKRKLRKRRKRRPETISGVDFRNFRI
jgi:5-methylcytosine-specific restriction endonuclease McrA